MLILGEVHTGLLQNSTAVSPLTCVRALSLLVGDRVARWERPIAHAASPRLLTGLDCRMPSRSGARSRAVGTAASRAMITGGHVLQGSTYLRVVAGTTSRRLPWSYYLSRPGTVETIGRLDQHDLAHGFVATEGSAAALDLGAISGRVMDSVQGSAGLDRRPPIRMTRTWLRWVATSTDPDSEPESSVRFTIDNDRIRTVWLRAHPEPTGPTTPNGPAGLTGLPRASSSPSLASPPGWPRLAEVAEDLALHDWLLTTLLRVIERSQIGAGSGSRSVERLRPAIDHLLHLWMPAARLDQPLAALWESLEQRPGFSRQWNASVARIRDHVAVNTLALLGAGAHDDTSQA
ncbi:MAG TPA: SCO2521 family protein [Mycobacteriales bacterium]